MHTLTYLLTIRWALALHKYETNTHPQKKKKKKKRSHQPKNPILHSPPRRATPRPRIRINFEKRQAGLGFDSWEMKLEILVEVSNENSVVWYPQSTCPIYQPLFLKYASLFLASPCPLPTLGPSPEPHLTVTKFLLSSFPFYSPHSEPTPSETGKRLNNEKD